MLPLRIEPGPKDLKIYFSLIQITIHLAHLNLVMIGQSIEITEVTQNGHQTIIPIAPLMVRHMVKELLVLPILVETMIIPRMYKKVPSENNLKKRKNLKTSKIQQKISKVKIYQKIEKF